MNKPHSREKRVIDKKVNVTKKEITRNETKNTTSIISSILGKLIKK